MVKETYDRKAWEKQQAFLEAYAATGQISAACERVGIHINTYRAWLRTNSNSFRDMHEHSEIRFKELKERQWLFDKLDSDPKANPQLVMFAMKGIWREKYGDTPAVNDQTVGDTLRALAALSKSNSEERKVENKVHSAEREFLNSLAEESETRT